MTTELTCQHDRWVLGDKSCECGAAILTTEQIRQFMVLRDEYDAEPDADDDDRDEDASVAATERDLEYWDWVGSILYPGL